MHTQTIKQILLSVFICCLLTGCTNNTDSKADNFITSARSFIAQKKPETAVIEYKNAIQVDPKNDVALFELAETYILLHKVNAAIRYYNLAAQANPDSIIAHLRLAQIYLQMEQLLDARKETSKALGILPDSIEALHILAGIQIKERDIESAIETLNMASTINNKNVKTFTSLAQLYLNTRQIPEAEKAYQTAIAIDSASREAYMGLARVYAFQGEFDKVEALLKTVLETPGIKAEKHTDLARFYEGQKLYHLAEAQYQQAITTSPKAVVPLVNLAEFYTKQKMKDKAIVTMQNALAKKKNTLIVLTGLSQIYLHFGIIDKASETVDQALARNSNAVDALFQKGRVLMAQNDFKQALDNFDRVIALDRINAKAYYYRALCIKERGATDRPEQKIFRAAAGLSDNPDEFERDQVRGNLLAAITVDPDLMDARIKLAEIYLVEQNLKKAKEQIDEIFKRQAPNLKTMTLLSGFHILEGNLTEAENILKIIIQEKPDYIPARIRLGLLYKAMGNKDGAINAFQAAYDKDTRQMGLVKMITEIFLEEKRYDAALDLVELLSQRLSLQTSLQASGQPATNNALAFFENLKAEIFINKKDMDNALGHLQRAVELQPDYIPPHNHMANIFARQKEQSKALEQFRIIEKLNPQYIPALMAIGTISDLSGNTSEAETYYRKVLELAPTHANAANNLAFILAEKKSSLEEAFRLAKIARDANPKDPNFLDTMGWLYYQKGIYLSARSELEDSLKIYPENALACFHYGMTLYQMKEYEKARRFFEKALEIDPGFQGAKIARRILN